MILDLQLNLGDLCVCPRIYLEPLADGRLLYRFKRPWRDRTTDVVFEPLELLEKFVAIIPAPKAHLVRYSGILGPAAKWRVLIVPVGSAGVSTTMLDSACAPETAVSTDSLALEEAVVPAESSPVGPRTVPHPRNYTWSELMKRVWALDVLEYPRCRSRMQSLAAIHPPDATRKILECLGLPSRANSEAIVESEIGVNLLERRWRHSGDA